MRFLVCGSRTFDNDILLCDVLYGMTYEEPDVVIIEGGAPGADTMAQEFAETFEKGWAHYPADWERYGKAAGHIRNKQMLVEGKPDRVVAFVDKPLAESRGTANMVKQARDAGVPVVVIEAW